MVSAESSNVFSRRQGVILCLIVMLALGLRAYWTPGFIPKDDAEFARVAYEMAQGTFQYEAYDGPPVIPVRTGIILPTAAAMGLFGPGEIQLAAYPWIMSAVLIVMIYLLTWRMFGHRAATIASGIWVFLPIELELATLLYPEVPATAFALIGIYCTYRGRGSRNASQGTQVLYGLLAGLAFGASWLCKESVVFYVPFCGLLILFDWKRTRFEKWPVWAGVAAGSLVVLIGEMIVYGIINGDWLYRFSTVKTNHQLYPEFFFTEGARFGYGAETPYWKALVKRLAIDGPALIFLSIHFLFLPFFGAVAAFYGWYRRDSRFYFGSVLMIVLVVMANAFSTSLQNYYPMPLFSRYFYPICVPAAVLTGGMLASLIPPGSVLGGWRERSESLFWGLLIAGVLLALIAWSTFRYARDFVGKWAIAEKYLAQVLSPADRIHADVLSRNALEFFWRYPEKTHISVYGDPGRTLNASCGDFVLRNLSYGDWLATNEGSYWNMRGYELPAEVQSPPESWRVRWTNGNATMFEVVCDE